LFVPIDLGNRLGDEGVKSIAEALWTNTTLEVIFLSSNSIMDGIRNFSHSVVIFVFFPDNGIYDEGAKYIAEALRTNTRISHLFMGGRQKLKGSIVNGFFFFIRFRK
jgi:hypothetical protein